MRSFAACLACAVVWLHALPAPAHACGGTFCDSASASAPVPMTVDQSGENILFVQLDGKIEVHVQIRYQGDPAQLAWLVPMPVVPEIEVGSQPLFDALLSGSAPRYGIRTTVMRCDGTSETTESSGCGDGSTSSPSFGGVAGSDTDTDSAMMMDPIGKTVGSFDVTILQPKLGDDVGQWIADNDFALPEATQDLLQPYIDAGSVFVAMRMAPGAGVQEIHPIVFRYPGTRPSIPIQLTAVAATADMRVRTFFLGQGRTVPSNYRHVEVDPVRLNWLSFASNYESAVSAAVDDTGDGLGFVTEYAGTSSVIDRSTVYDPRWDADAFVGLDPFQALDELRRQGQLSCQNGVCAFPHPLVLPLLERYIPAPAGTNENAFYTCLSCAEDQVDLKAWDPQAFAHDYQERVIDPALHARELLDTNMYLTRMITFIDPEEMIADPAFHQRPDLPQVGREHWASSTISCEGDQDFRLPDGREVVLTGFGFSWPGSDASVPNAERIELIPEHGDPVVVIDASADIDASLEKINARNRRQVDGVSNLSMRGGGACSVSSGFAQQNAWIGAALLYLASRRRRRGSHM